MLPLFYTNTVLATIFWIAYTIWGVPEIIGTFTQKARVKATVQDRGSNAILFTAIFGSILLAFFLALRFPQAAIPWHRTLLFLSGTALILVGVALRWYAIRVLGRYFTRNVAVQPDQQVIESGPYRFIRHPSYSGGMLSILGLGLALTNWASILALIVCTFVGYFYRVHVEEQALARTIGQPYVDYMQRTRRFIPFIL